LMIGHESRTSLISSAVGTDDAPPQTSLPTPQVRVFPFVVMEMVVLCYIDKNPIIFARIEQFDWK